MKLWNYGIVELWNSGIAGLFIAEWWERELEVEAEMVRRS